MFFKKKDKNIHDTSVTGCAEKAKIKDEKFKVKEPEKKKINPKVVFRIVVIVLVILVILGIIGHFEVQKREEGESYNTSLSHFMNNKYDRANKVIRGISPETEDEKAYIEIIKLSEDIPENIESFNDIDDIEEYIEILEKMKSIVQKRKGITITVYNKGYKDITITEVAFEDAIYYAEQEKAEIEEKKTLIFSNKSDSKFNGLDIPKTIGFFISVDNIKGNGTSYYEK